MTGAADEQPDEPLDATQQVEETPPGPAVLSQVPPVLTASTDPPGVVGALAEADPDPDPVQLGEAAGAVIESDTWTGVEEAVNDPPVRRDPATEISMADRMALNEQSQRHRLQLYAAAGIAAMTLLMFVITLTARAVNALDAQVTLDIIHTLIGPMVVSGLIAIVAWLFGNGR